MNQIQVAEHKTLKLTNVLSRCFTADEMPSMNIILTQMENFIKSSGAQPLGPLVQYVEIGTGENPEPKFYFMRQCNNFITHMNPGYHMDAVLRVKGCLYAHYTGPMSKSQLASQKLTIYAFENDIKLRNNVYTIYVSGDDDDAVVDVFMETEQ